MRPSFRISQINKYIMRGVDVGTGFPGGTVLKNPPANAGDPGSISGEGNGTLFQYSCLENSMDRGTWWATVYVATKSQTRLSDNGQFLKSSIFAPLNSSSVYSQHSSQGQSILSRVQIFLTLFSKSYSGFPFYSKQKLKLSQFPKRFYLIQLPFILYPVSSTIFHLTHFSKSHGSPRVFLFFFF